MLEPNRIRTSVCPLTIQKLGNGTYYYNYDIQVGLVENLDGDLEDQYNFILVLLRGQPNYKDCVRAIIRSFITIDEEFDLINSYNSYSLKLVTDSKIVSEYTNYLDKLNEIKTKIREDFAKL